MAEDVAGEDKRGVGASVVVVVDTGYVPVGYL
jgi:hypothetical protein